MRHIILLGLFSIPILLSAQLTVTTHPLARPNEMVVRQTSGAIALDRTNNQLVLSTPSTPGNTLTGKPGVITVVRLDDQGQFQTFERLSPSDDSYKQLLDKKEGGLSYRELVTDPPNTPPVAADDKNTNFIYLKKGRFDRLTRFRNHKIDFDITADGDPFGGPAKSFATGMFRKPLQVSDPASGTTLIVGDLSYAKDKTKKNAAHFEHLIVTIDSTGKVLASVPFPTEAPYRTAYALPIYNNTTVGGTGEYHHVACILGGSKIKNGPATAPTEHIVIIVDLRTGQITATDEFTAPGRLTSFITQFNSKAGHTTHLSLDEGDDGDFLCLLALTKDGIADYKVFAPTTPEYQALVKYTNNVRSNTKFKTVHGASGAAGATYVVKTLFTPDARQVMDADPKDKLVAGVEGESACSAVAFGPDGLFSGVTSLPVRTTYEYIADSDGALTVLQKQQGASNMLLWRLSPDGTTQSVQLPTGHVLLPSKPLLHDAKRRIYYAFSQNANTMDRGLSLTVFNY